MSTVADTIRDPSDNSPRIPRPPRAPRINPLGTDFSELPAEERELYVSLIRDGRPSAIAQASALYGGARRDAAAVKHALQVLARKPNTAAAKQSLAALDKEIDAVEAQVAELVQRQNELVGQRSDLANAAGADGSWRNAIVVATSEAIVVAALRPELKAAGLL